jgi:hypothetical protein
MFTFKGPPMLLSDLFQNSTTLVSTQPRLALHRSNDVNQAQQRDLSATGQRPAFGISEKPTFKQFLCHTNELFGWRSAP